MSRGTSGKDNIRPGQLANIKDHDVFYTPRLNRRMDMLDVSPNKFIELEEGKPKQKMKITLPQVSILNKRK